jgi:hypothetical protein
VPESPAGDSGNGAWANWRSAAPTDLIIRSRERCAVADPIACSTSMMLRCPSRPSFPRPLMSWHAFLAGGRYIPAGGDSVQITVPAEPCRAEASFNLRNNRLLLLRAPPPAPLRARQQLNSTHRTISCIGANHSACTVANRRRIVPARARRPLTDSYARPIGF